MMKKIIKKIEKQTNLKHKLYDMIWLKFDHVCIKDWRLKLENKGKHTKSEGGVESEASSSWRKQNT
jgi:hypothetical protein